MPYSGEPDIEDIRWYGTKARAREARKLKQMEYDNWVVEQQRAK